MEKYRIERWNGNVLHVAYSAEEWWFVAKDVCGALGIEDAGDAVKHLVEDLDKAGSFLKISKRLTLDLSLFPDPSLTMCSEETTIAEAVSNRVSDSNSYADIASDGERRTQKYICVNEVGVNLLIMRSRKSDAMLFQVWLASEVLPTLRKSLDLSPYESFRMMDKEHQRSCMDDLKAGLKRPVKVDYIRANQITNKAIANKFGFEKLVKKGAMTEDMLRERQWVLETTKDLMVAKERFNLDISVSDKIYGMVGNDRP